MHKRMVMSFSTLFLFLASSLLAAVDPLQPEIIEKPQFKAKDTWTFRINNRLRTGETKETHMVISIVRASSDSILQSAKAVDSSMPPVEKLLGADLSIAASINGEEVIVHKPFDFPMKLDKKWVVSYQQEHPVKNLKSNRVELNYTVVGWEEVSVPAGKFRALKVEAGGTWHNVFNETPMSTGSVSQVDKDGAVLVLKNQQPTVPPPVMGRYFRTYWYVQAAKRAVKAVEEEFSSNGTLSTKSTWELESYQLAGNQ